MTVLRHPAGKVKESAITKPQVLLEVHSREVGKAREGREVREVVKVVGVKFTRKRKEQPVYMSC